MKALKKKGLIAITLVLLIAAATVVLLWHPRHHEANKPSVPTGPVPLAVKNAVSFPVYYPDQSKLPAGYILDTNSFSTPVKNGVNYTVTYDTSKKIVFSVQAKPSDSELQTFNSSYIPLRIDYQTPLGQAEIGSYNSHTLASLPIVNGPWVVITAPSNINQDNLKKVISSLRHP